MKSTRFISNPRGFSLIEIIITLSVAGILSGIVGLNLLEQLPKYRLNGATRELGWDLMTARLRAIREKHTVTVTFAANHHEYTIWVDKNDDMNRDAGEETTKDLHEDYHTVHFTALDNPVFSTTGRITNPTNITIVLAGYIIEETKSISINTAGMVKLD